MNYWSPASCGLLGLGIVFLLIQLLLGKSRWPGSLQRARDFHHTHKAPVPRLGGVALAAAFLGIELFTYLFFKQARGATPGHAVVVLSSLAMFGLGFWDDLKPLGARYKLLGQLAIASAVYFCGLGIQSFKIPFTGNVIGLNVAGYFFTVFWLVGMTNLINLIDGVDGLAGGICLMLMTLLAYVGHNCGSYELLVAGMAGALLGFLWFNFPPAKIYLGDGGAYFLGFQVGLFSLINYQKGPIIAALAAPLFVLALPIVDTSLAILRRGLRGLPLFRPDRNHLHHHLMASGMSRRRVVLSFYGVTLVFLAMGFAAFVSHGQLVPVLLGLAALILLGCAGKLRFSREWFSVGRVVGDSLGMRQEVQYALSITRWLALEGERAGAIESLWQDFIFVARKLGFSQVKLALADGEKVWEEAQCAESCRATRYELQAGRCGILTLEAPICQFKTEHGSGGKPWECRRPACPCIGDERLFQILAELLAEGWIKASSKFLADSRGPLSFLTIRPVNQSQPEPPGKTSSLAEPAAASQFCTKTR